MGARARPLRRRRDALRRKYGETGDVRARLDGRGRVGLRKEGSSEGENEA